MYLGLFPILTAFAQNVLYTVPMATVAYPNVYSTHYSTAISLCMSNKTSDFIE